MAVTAGPLDANTRGTPLASEDDLALASLFKAYTISATFEGQTVEQAIEVSGARTDVKFPR